MHGWEVPDVEDAADQLVRAGVVVNRYDGLGQDERGHLDRAERRPQRMVPRPDGNDLSLRQRGRD